MSRAFVREEDGDLPEDLPELPVSPHPNYVTPRGLALLETELSELLEKLATLDPKQMDFRQQTALLERRERWLRTRISGAILVAPEDTETPPAQVGFGHYVQLMDEVGEIFYVQIVGEDESDPNAQRVSWRSPLAQSLMGAEVGEERLWKRPAGDIYVEVMAISHRAPTSL